MSFEITNRWTAALLYKSETAQTIAEAVSEALKNSANLGGANLRGANLREANLRGANLCGANLSEANLRGANLRGANLRGANLSEANLRGANLSGANLSEANLRGANLSEANLRGANLREANLRGANLSGANLSEADLCDANLREANLRGANLSGAVGLNKYLTTPLHMLRDQPGKIRAYKLVTADLRGPHYPQLEYVMGLHLECEADTDESISCGKGLNVATLDWVMREWHPGYRILVIEHKAEDIAAIPLGSDGKYRVHRLDVVAEKDLVELGLIAPVEVTA